MIETICHWNKAPHIFANQPTFKVTVRFAKKLNKRDLAWHSIYVSRRVWIAILNNAIVTRIFLFQNFELTAMVLTVEDRTVVYNSNY